jgi:hypothetical protein
MVRATSAAGGRKISCCVINSWSYAASTPARVRLWNIDRLLLIWLYRLYASLLDAIIIVKRETVIRWHQRGLPCLRAGSPAAEADVRGLLPRFER